MIGGLAEGTLGDPQLVVGLARVVWRERSPKKPPGSMAPAAVPARLRTLSSTRGAIGCSTWPQRWTSPSCAQPAAPLLRRCRGSWRSNAAACLAGEVRSHSPGSEQGSIPISDCSRGSSTSGRLPTSVFLPLLPWSELVASCRACLLLASRLKALEVERLEA